MAIENPEVQDSKNTQNAKLNINENSYDVDEMRGWLSEPESQVIQVESQNQNENCVNLSDDGDDSVEIALVINKTTQKDHDKNNYSANDIESEEENTEEYRKISTKIKEDKRIQKNIEKMYNQGVESRDKWRDEIIDSFLDNQHISDEAGIIKWQQKFRWYDEVHRINREIFGNEEFLPNQLEIINATKWRRDVIALIPTGGGKSLTFQLPSLTEIGFTIVVMPLLSLIEDQMQAMGKIGVKSFFFSGSGKHKRFLEDLSKNKLDDLKLIYLTPEKLLSWDSLLNCLDHLYRQRLIQRFVIDEAHCISQWGKDFRTDYLGLKMIKKRFKATPILALTAVATEEVRKEIKSSLRLPGETVFFLSSFNRPNLHYEVKHSKWWKDIIKDITNLLKNKFCNQSGIIYWPTKKEWELLADDLTQNYGILWATYHASMKDDERRTVQFKWMDNEIKVIIATIAFGMGINKKDVRFVIHYKLPKSLENYIQECGRAGRDRKIANWIMYYSYWKIMHYLKCNIESCISLKIYLMGLTTIFLRFFLSILQILKWFILCNFHKWILIFCVNIICSIWWIRIIFIAFH